jgi:hypothetical protein
MRGLLLALTLSVALSTSAFATAELQLKSGLTTVTILDNGVGDADPAIGQVIFSGAVGSWSINLTSGLSFGPLGPTMDVGSLDATTSSADPLTITFTDTGFSTPSPGFMLASSGHIVTGSGTAMIKGWVDDTNTVFGEPAAGLIGSLGPFSGAYFQSVTGGPAGVPLYSLTEAVTLTTGSSGVTWGTDSSIAPVPEPAAVALFGSVLLLCASKLRRRKVS